MFWFTSLAYLFCPRRFGFGLTGNGKGKGGAGREDGRDPALAYNFGLFILRPKGAGV